MSLPPVRIEDRDFDVDPVYLWNVQQAVPRRQSHPDVDAIYSQDSDKAFLVGLEEQESIRINGTASAFRISNHGNYSDDPLTALAEFALELLAFVNGAQGVGWHVINEYTGRKVPAVVERVDISTARAEKYEFSYSMGLRAGQGMMPDSPLSPGVADPSTTARIAGEDMKEIEEMMITKRQHLEVRTYAIHDFWENDVQARSGAVREFHIRGVYPGDEADRKQFDDAIRVRTGQNLTVDFESAFPGETYETMIADYESTREAGNTQIGEYLLELTEGHLGSADGSVGSESELEA